MRSLKVLKRVNWDPYRLGYKWLDQGRAAYSQWVKTLLRDEHIIAGRDCL